MSDILNLITKKMIEGKTANEICGELNLSRNKLHYYLRIIKDSGFQFSITHDINGEIKFDFDPTKLLFLSNGITTFNVQVPSSNSEVKVLAISDLHFGNELERRDAVDAMFEYCIKNGIHVILCCGDIVDGTFSRGNQTIPDAMKQLEYFIKNYPYDKNIVTLAVLGDHDFSVLRDYSYDPIQIIRKNRSDIAIGGYNYSLVRMRNEKILLHHYIDAHLPTPQTSHNLILRGHFHEYSARIENGTLHINVPSLSSIITNIPSALELELKFKNNFLNNVFVRQLAVVNGSTEKINCIQYYIGAGDAQDVQLNNNVKKKK